MRPLESFIQDARHSIRILYQNPGFSLVAILSLAFGANTAIFTLIDAALPLSLPVRDPQQLAERGVSPVGVYVRAQAEGGLCGSFTGVRSRRSWNRVENSVRNIIFFLPVGTAPA